MTEEEDLRLARKELARQSKRRERRDDVAPQLPLELMQSYAEAMQGLSEALEDFQQWSVSEAFFEKQVKAFAVFEQRFFQAVEEATRAAGDPCSIMSMRTGYEAAAKGHSLTAQILGRDAAGFSARGSSCEEWIIEVLQGHNGDQDTQLGCLKEIVSLWTYGPWPWREG